MNMNFDKSMLNSMVIKEIIPLLDKNSELYIVGGYLRDMLLGHESLDMDFIIKGQEAIELAKNFADKTGRYFIMLDNEHEIARVVDKDKLHYFDFARCEHDDIRHDLSRRDLTINSIAIRLYPNFEIFDINNGTEDFNNKRINIINEKNMTDDPLRLLRIFRFASILNFDINEKAIDVVKKHAHLINNVASERILTELAKLFEGNNSAKYLILMKETGLLYEVFGILKPVAKIPPNSHHHLPLIDHCIETVRQAEIKLQTCPEFLKKHWNESLSGIKYLSLFKMACLLHDVGKPQTWTIEENGRHRFINHDSIGADLLKPILKEMKFSKLQIKYITTLVKNHIYPSQLARIGEEINVKAVMRMFRKLETCTPDILILAMADRLSAQGPDITKEMTEHNISMLNTYMDMYEEYIETAKPLPKLLDGNEIAEILNIKKDKKLGEIILKLKNAQMSGEVNSKEEALIYLKKLTELSPHTQLKTNSNI